MQKQEANQNADNFPFSVKSTDGKIFELKCSFFRLKEEVQKREKNIPIERILLRTQKNQIWSLSSLISKHYRNCNQDQNTFLTVMDAETLYAELQQLKREIIAKNKDIESQNEFIGNIKNELEQQKNRVQQVEKEKNQRLQSQISQKKTELELQKEQFETQMTELEQQWAGEMRLLQISYDKSEKDKSELTLEIESLITERKNFQLESEQKLENLSLEKNKLQFSIEELKQEIAVKDQQLQGYMAYCGQCEQYIAGWQQKSYQQDAEIYNLKAEIQSLTNGVEQTQALLTAKTQANIDLTKLNQELKQQVNDLEQQNEEHKKFQNKLKSQFENLTKKNQQLQQEIRDQEQELMKLQALPIQIKSLEQENKRLKDRFKQEREREQMMSTQ